MIKVEGLPVVEQNNSVNSGASSISELGPGVNRAEKGKHSRGLRDEPIFFNTAISSRTFSVQS